jgi:riboflavin synthase
MFTGIVETAAEVLERTDHSLLIRRPEFFTDIALGASIAVAGTCLSAVRITPESIGFDIVPETFARTTLGRLRPGDTVNLERSMLAGARFEGHVVQGHIEGVGEVMDNKDFGSGQGWKLIIKIPQDLLGAVVPKGSIAIEGVSLTVAALEGDRCTIALIPHTLEVTTLGRLKAGDGVNLETDIMMRGLSRLLALTK